MGFTNSSLATLTMLSPNYTSGRNGKTISRFTPHCVVGQATAKRIGEIFQNRDRDASCTYGIGLDGTIILIVEEKNRSWCTGGDKTVSGMTGSKQDYEAITVEVASDNYHPYAFTSAAYESLVKLCVDCCKRNGKTKTVWKGTAEATEAYAKNGLKADEMLLTVHRWYASKACPGDWMFSRMQAFSDEVNRRLGAEPSGDTLYRVQIGAYRVKANAERQLQKAKDAGFSDAFIVEVKKDPTPTPEPQPDPIKVGDEVWVKEGAYTYNGNVKLADFVYHRPHDVMEISGDRVVITYGGVVVAAVKMTDLYKK